MNTPVALFIFNRPDTTAHVWNVLRAVRPRVLYLIADGPRPGHPNDPALCAAARALVTAPDWPCELHLDFAETNLGTKRRIESGLTWVFSREPRAIILEDDCAPHPTFFPYCTELLARYQNEPRVMSIAGSSMRADPINLADSYYFSRYSFIWGWATWARAWARYDITMSEWPARRETRWLDTQLETPLAQRYWEMQFQQNYAAPHTWDYAWIFSTWLAGGLHIVPRVNLVSNLGHNLASTHTHDDHDPFANLATRAMDFPLVHPNRIGRNTALDAWNEQHIYSGKDYLATLFHTIRTELKTGRAARSNPISHA